MAFTLDDGNLGDAEKFWTTSSELWISQKQWKNRNNAMPGLHLPFSTRSYWADGLVREAEIVAKCGEYFTSSLCIVCRGLSSGADLQLIRNWRKNNHQSGNNLKAILHIVASSGWTGLWYPRGNFRSCWLSDKWGQFTRNIAMEIIPSLCGPTT